MAIATATQAQVKAAQVACDKLSKELQFYVQGSANGPTGIKGKLTAAQVNALAADVVTKAGVIAAA